MLNPIPIPRIIASKDIPAYAANVPLNLFSLVGSGSGSLFLLKKSLSMPTRINDRIDNIGGYAPMGMLK